MRKARINELISVRFNEAVRGRVKAVVVHRESWRSMVGVGSDMISKPVQIGGERLSVV